MLWSNAKVAWGEDSVETWTWTREECLWAFESCRIWTPLVKVVQISSLHCPLLYCTVDNTRINVSSSLTWWRFDFCAFTAFCEPISTFNVISTAIYFPGNHSFHLCTILHLVDGDVQRQILTWQRSSHDLLIDRVNTTQCFAVESTHICRLLHRSPQVNHLQRSRCRCRCRWLQQYFLLTSSPLCYSQKIHRGLTMDVHVVCGSSKQMLIICGYSESQYILDAHKGEALLCVRCNPPLLLVYVNVNMR